MHPLRQLAGRWAWAIFLVVSLIPILWAGLQQEIMEVDSAQYASMSREMLEGAPLTELTEHGQRYQSRGYPDKPPLIFWTGAWGMKILGPNEAGFRLFSWLAAALAIWAVGNWARLLMGEASVGPTRWVYAFNLGMLLMNVDLRTDSLLLSLTTIALWQGQAFMLHRTTTALMGFVLALAFALMAKGPIAAVAVVVGLLPSLPLAERRRKMNAHVESLSTFPTIRLIPALLLVVVGVFVLLSPTLWGLYRQWGWHEGVRYYLWTQSFGRITGENPWANEPGGLFLTGSLAWSFMPWTLVLCASIGHAISSIRREKWNDPGIGACLGFLFLTVALSSSAYQLPHYIYIVWPFISVLCGRTLSEIPIRKAFWIGQHILLVLLLLANACVLALFAERPILSSVCSLTWLVLSFFITNHFFKSQSLFMARTVVIFILVAAALLLVFYPKVLPYQAGARAAQTYHSLHSGDPLWILGCGDESLHNLHFYSRRIVPVAAHPDQLPSSPLWIYTDTKGKADLVATGRTIDSLVTFPFTRVTTLKPDFFHPGKREKMLENRYLIRIQAIFAPARL